MVLRRAVHSCSDVSGDAVIALQRLRGPPWGRVPHILYDFLLQWCFRLRMEDLAVVNEDGG